MSKKKSPELRKLTSLQILFVECYLQSFNATQAAQLAGYKGNRKTLSVMGSENLAKPNIRAYIEKRFEAEVMKSNEVLSRLSKMARAFDIADYIEQEPVYQVNKEGDEYMSGYALKVNFEQLQKDGYSHLIKKVKQTGRGGIEIEWHDQMAALVHVGKHHALFTDLVKSMNLNIDMTKLTNQQLERIAAGEDIGEVVADG